MFCVQCGKKLPDDAKFCSDCGTQVHGIKISSTSIQKISSQSVLSDKVIGSLHWDVVKLSQKLSQDYVLGVMRRDLDEFIMNAEKDIDIVFSKVDTYFQEFLRKNGIYQFQEKQISQYTRKYVGRWLNVFNEALSAYQRITGKAQEMRQYRELRKDSRLQLVGGGFSASSAAKGIATAGAINFVTGTLHSVVNSLGNARSEAEARRKKSEFFYQESFSKSLELTIQLDCYSMLGGFADLWNELDIGNFRFYSEEDMNQASNILFAIAEGSVPQNQIASALEKMISIYPVIPDVYLAAIRYMPASKSNYFALADRYGLNLQALQTQSKDAAGQQIKILLENDIFLDNCEELSRDLKETLEYMGDAYKDVISGQFVIFSEQYKKKYHLKMQWMRDSFVSYSNAETPILCIDPTLTGTGTSGIFLTDRHLFIYGGKYNGGLQTYTLESIREVYLEKDPSNGVFHFGVNDGPARVMAYSSNNNSTILDLIAFFVHYCLFLKASQSFSTGDFMGDILEISGYTEEEFYALIDDEDDDDEDDDDEDDEDEGEYVDNIHTGGKIDKQILRTIQTLCNEFLRVHPGSVFAVSPELLREHSVGKDEKVFLGHDDTLFHTGKNGFALTDKGIYCREMMEKTSFTSYAALEQTRGKIYDRFSCIYADNFKLAYISTERSTIKDLIALFQHIREELINSR